MASVGGRRVLMKVLYNSSGGNLPVSKLKMGGLRQWKRSQEDTEHKKLEKRSNG